MDIGFGIKCDSNLTIDRNLRATIPDRNRYLSEPENAIRLS
jgi:hypothetical protein